MGVVEQTSGAVESQLSTLEESYGSFSVNQRTVAVPTTEYETRRNSRQEVDLYAKVTNNQSEVLYVDTGGSKGLPSTTATVEGGLEHQLQAIVENRTGVSCQIDGIEAVTILGLRDTSNSDRETVYTLAILFDAEYTDGSLRAQAAWQQFDADDHPAYA
jgi:hypothetical protein